MSLQVYVEPISPSACSPDCKMLLGLVEDPRGYNITLTSSRNDAPLEAKTFHFSKCLWTDTTVLVVTRLLIN